VIEQEKLSMTALRVDARDTEIEVLTTTETAARLGVAVWHLRRVLDSEGLVRRAGPYRVILNIDLPAIRKALVSLGYLDAEAKGGGISSEGALQVTREKKGARGLACPRAPTVGSAAPAKSVRASVRNPEAEGPDRGNRTS
jgi:hypothetical protein